MFIKFLSCIFMINTCAYTMAVAGCGVGYDEVTIKPVISGSASGSSAILPLEIWKKINSYLDTKSLMDLTSTSGMMRSDIYCLLTSRALRSDRRHTLKSALSFTRDINRNDQTDFTSMVVYLKDDIVWDLDAISILGNIFYNIPKKLTLIYTLPQEKNDLLLGVLIGYSVICPQAQYSLAIAYRHGQLGLAINDAEALKYYRLAADQKHADAQHNLAYAYEHGQLGLAINHREALKYYRLAAGQGLALAQYNLALCHARGRLGLVVNDAEALKYYQLAAGQGLALAQCVLALSHEHGQLGLAINDAEASRLYRLAAGQGFAGAQYILGYAYEHGRLELPIDHAETLRLYRLAAGQGLGEAQYHLALSHEHGQLGLAINDAEALRLYRLAADKGLREAQDALRRLGH
jgi:TPR repeat protein